MSILKFGADRLPLSSGVAFLAAIFLCAFTLSSSALAQGKIVGHIDGVTFDGTNGVVRGWACQQGRPESIAVQVFADGKFLVGGKADLKNEPGVNQACRVQGSQHRFQIVLPREPFAQGRERILSVRGIRLVGNVENAAIAGSGSTRFRLPTAIPGVSGISTASSEYPRLRGAYISSKQHPRVFMTPADISNLVARINSPGSFSTQVFSTLANQVKADLSASVDWDTAYSGCDIEIYLDAFSYDRPNPHTASQLRAAMNVRPGMAPPSGAAIVASKLALYAALVKEGAKTRAGAPTADQAIALSKRILMTWTAHGFRDQEGHYLRRPEQFCDNGKFIPIRQSTVGLQIARGVIYSVHAQDLLQFIGALDAKEVGELNTFHAAMFELIHQASNFAFYLPDTKVPYRTCERFSNHFNAHLMGLLSIARLFDDGRKFNAVLYGNDRTIPVALPYTVYFNHAIYGYNDKPIQCYKNSSPDSRTTTVSHKGFFQTPRGRLRIATDTQIRRKLRLHHRC